MHSIFTIFKKELKRSFTDFRVLLSMFLPGLIIFLMYAFMGSIINGVVEQQTSYTDFIVRVENCPNDDAFTKIFESLNYKVTDIYTDIDSSSTITKDEFLDKISNKEADMYVIYEEDFLTKAQEHKLDPDKPTPNVEIYFNSSRDESILIYEQYTAALNQYESSNCNMFDINKDTTTKYDLSKPDDSSRKFISMMLPFILIIFIFSGALSFCADSFAGEKERGTMATLLMTPVKRREIAMGKILALSIMALVSATTSFLGILFSLPKMMGSASGAFSFNVYGPGTYILLFLVLVSITLFFISILALISAFSKSVREASAMSLPVMFFVMFIGISAFMSSGATSNTALYVIPVYGTVQTLIGLLSGSLNSINLIITIISNLFYAGIIVVLLTRMLNSEKIMFKK